MGITFNGYMGKHKYFYRAKNLDEEGNRLFVYGNDLEEFVNDLEKFGLYKEYMESLEKERNKGIPIHEGQYTLDDYLGG